MTASPRALRARPAWRAFIHARHQLNASLNQHLLWDSGLSEADYEILAVLITSRTFIPLQPPSLT
jgi:uncharacterized protein YjiS (DUF1127 family)